MTIDELREYACTDDDSIGNATVGDIFQVKHGDPFVYATNRRMCVRIPTTEFAAAPEWVNIGVNPEWFTNRRAERLKIPKLPPLEERYQICDCWAKGIPVWKCEQCKADGFIRYERNVAVGRFFYWESMLQSLAGLPGVQAFEHASADGKLVFEFEGGQAVLMNTLDPTTGVLSRDSCAVNRWEENRAKPITARLVRCGQIRWREDAGQAKSEL